MAPVRLVTGSAVNMCVREYGLSYTFCQLGPTTLSTCDQAKPVSEADWRLCNLLVSDRKADRRQNH